MCLGTMDKQKQNKKELEGDNVTRIAFVRGQV